MESASTLRVQYLSIFRTSSRDLFEWWDKLTSCSLVQSCSHCTWLTCIFELPTKACCDHFTGVMSSKRLKSIVCQIETWQALILRSLKQPCWVWFLGSEKLDSSRNGRMERNFPVIPICQILGQPRQVHPKFRSIRSPTRNLRNIGPTGKPSQNAVFSEGSFRKNHVLYTFIYHKQTEDVDRFWNGSVDE